MLNLYNGAGMGAAGMGMGGAGAVPNALSPQLMAMLSALHQGSGASVAPGAAAAPTMASPMAAYLGSAGNAAGMHAPMGAPVSAPPGAPVMGATPQNPAAPMAQTMQLLQQLKGSQNGVAPSLPANTPNLIFNPNNPVGTSQLNNTTANHGSFLGNLMNGGGLAGLLGGGLGGGLLGGLFGQHAG